MQQKKARRLSVIIKKLKRRLEKLSGDYDLLLMIEILSEELRKEVGRFMDFKTAISVMEQGEGVSRPEWFDKNSFAPLGKFLMLRNNKLYLYDNSVPKKVRYYPTVDDIKATWIKSEAKKLKNYVKRNNPDSKG